MKNRGITLITVVVIIIIIVIIATTSLVAGNKLMVNAKILKDAQITESVKEALSRRTAEITMQGVITPKGDSYPGKVDPLIGDGTIVAKGWYLLEESDLINLGIKDVEDRFLVNYDYNEALNFTDNLYLEKFFVITFMHKVIDNNSEDPNIEFVGEKLYNKTSSNDTEHKMYKNETGSTPEYFGNGWYFVTTNEMTQVLKEIDYIKDYDFDTAITNNYLINYEKNKYVVVTSKYSEV